MFNDQNQNNNQDNNNDNDYIKYDVTNNDQNNSANQIPDQPNNSSPQYPNDDSNDKSANYQYDNGQWHYSAPNSPKRPNNSSNSNGMKILAIVMTIAFVLVTGGFGIYIAYDSGLLLSELDSSSQYDESNSEMDSSSSVDQGQSSSADNNNSAGLKVKDVPLSNPSNVDEGSPLTARAIYKKVSPAVVGIITYAQTNNGEYQALSQGTGIIFSSDGYIITNSHVVEDGQLLGDLNEDGKVDGKYQVVLKDKTEYEATVVGYDKKTDLAVMKIDATNLPTAEFGNSDQTEVGEPVIAIGNPYDLEFAGTTTQGIISGVNSTINVGTSSYTMKTLQTDAAINPGNSGGPLINEYGQVIGINSAKIASQDIEGMGFAIPINTAQPIVDNLVKYGYVKDRVRIGITFVSISSVDAKINNLPAGLRVQSVDKNTDAYKQGVQSMDIIYKIDGNEVSSYKNVSEIFEGKKPGDKVLLSVFRVNPETGERENLELTIALEEDIPLD